MTVRVREQAVLTLEPADMYRFLTDGLCSYSVLDESVVDGVFVNGDGTFRVHLSPKPPKEVVTK